MGACECSNQKASAQLLAEDEPPDALSVNVDHLVIDKVSSEKGQDLLVQPGGLSQDVETAGFEDIVSESQAAASSEVTKDSHAGNSAALTCTSEDLQPICKEMQATSEAEILETQNSFVGYGDGKDHAQEKTIVETRSVEKKADRDLKPLSENVVTDHLQTQASPKQSDDDIVKTNGASGKAKPKPKTKPKAKPKGSVSKTTVEATPQQGGNEVAKTSGASGKAKPKPKTKPKAKPNGSAKKAVEKTTETSSPEQESDALRAQKAFHADMEKLLANFPGIIVEGAFDDEDILDDWEDFFPKERNFQGTWRCTKVDGDIDNFLKKHDSGGMPRKEGGAKNLGIAVGMLQIVEQSCSRYVFSLSLDGISRKHEIVVSGLPVPGRDLEGKPCNFRSTWDVNTLVIIVDRPDGSDPVEIQQSLEGGMLLTQYSVGGIAVRCLYEPMQTSKCK